MIQQVTAFVMSQRAPLLRLVLCEVSIQALVFVLSVGGSVWHAQSLLQNLKKRMNQAVIFRNDKYINIRVHQREMKNNCHERESSRASVGETLE